MAKVDFATFCYVGDIDRLYKPGQFELQIKSNGYSFYRHHIIYQLVDIKPWPSNFPLPINLDTLDDEQDIDDMLKAYGIDPLKPQYQSDTDKAHLWRYHVVNHLTAISHSSADFIVFADADCWMVEQPVNQSWIGVGIDLLRNNRDIFIVSPNDGEPERKTLRMSQQMFMVRVEEFRHANFSQPGYTGNPEDYDTMPEYHAMLEGRMEYHCRESGQYRYVLGPEFRYFHHNRLDKSGHYDTDYKKLGWV